MVLTDRWIHRPININKLSIHVSSLHNRSLEHRFVVGGYLVLGPSVASGVSFRSLSESNLATLPLSGVARQQQCQSSKGQGLRRSGVIYSRHTELFHERNASQPHLCCATRQTLRPMYTRPMWLASRTWYIRSTYDTQQRYEVELPNRLGGMVRGESPSQLHAAEWRTHWDVLRTSAYLYTPYI